MTFEDLRWEVIKKIRKFDSLSSYLYKRQSISFSQPIQLECFKKHCFFYKKKKCTNSSPVLSLDPNQTFICWDFSNLIKTKIPFKTNEIKIYGFPDPSSLIEPPFIHKYPRPLFQDPRIKEGNWMNPVKIPLLKEIPRHYNKTISIIMTNYHCLYFLPFAIGIILKQRFPFNLFEIIVIDDNSTDKKQVFQLIQKIKKRHPKLDISLFETHQNVTKNITLAFNIGVKKAKYDVVIISSSNRFQLGSYLETVSRYFTFFDKKNVQIALSPLLLTSRKNDLIFMPRVVTDLGLAIARTNLCKITGYDESMIGWGSQEPDLCGRIGLSGVGIGFCANLVLMIKLDRHHFESFFKTKMTSEMGTVTSVSHLRMNSEISQSNYDKKRIAPNKTWGELNTLEQII